VSAHIAIIEDDQQTARRMAWILSDAGYDASLYDSIDDAIAGSAERSPEIVIYDTEADPPDKAVQIARLHEAAPGTRVIDLTTWARSRGRPADGAARALMRPFHAEALTSMVEELLDGPSAPPA
jgi:DNA-binding NtrC family response regulator